MKLKIAIVQLEWRSLILVFLCAKNGRQILSHVVIFFVLLPVRKVILVFTLIQKSKQLLNLQVETRLKIREL